MCALSKFSPWGARESLAPQILFLAVNVLVLASDLFLGVGGGGLCVGSDKTPFGAH